MGCGASVASTKAIQANGRAAEASRAGAGATAVRSLFKQLGVAPTRSTETSVGQIELALRYHDVKQLLLVKIIRARNLAARDAFRNTSDAYVRLALLPGSARAPSGEHRTRIVRSTAHPSFNELFSFSVPNDDLPSTRLVCSVWDYDAVTSDDLIGRLSINLSGVDWTRRDSTWYDLKHPSISSLSGSVHVTLLFSLPSTLHVTLHRVSDVKREDAWEEQRQEPNTISLKCFITGLASVEKSLAVSINEKIDVNFKFSIIDTQEKALAIRVLDSEGKAQSEGIAYISLNDLQPSVEHSGTYSLSPPDVQWMSENQQTALLQESRHAFAAHMLLRQPAWLFERKSLSDAKKLNVVVMKNANTGQTASTEVKA
ncbi:synaptotagmin-2-like [Oscarella lobularis]|uniref:synaptotagmin-2-like n=1 Tax=Oscarella lobularis TaxID=121494 RepID=UPI0033131BE1